MRVCELSPIPSEVALSVPSSCLSRSCPRQETVFSMHISGLIPQAIQRLAEQRFVHRPCFGLLVCQMVVSAPIWSGLSLYV